MSFEIVSYFDIRISNLVAAKGRARFFVVKIFLVAAMLRCGYFVFIPLEKFVELIKSKVV